ncbi:MAG: glycosyl hydrolase family 18 protein [Bacillota bacterium]
MKKICFVFFILLLGIAPVISSAEEISMLKGDINENGIVNDIDLRILSEHLSLTDGNMQYDASKDLNDDGIIDALDLEMLAQGISGQKLHGFYPKEVFKSNNFNQKDLIKYFNDVSFAFYDVTYDAGMLENYGIKINSTLLDENHIEALQIAKQNNIPIRFNVFSNMGVLKNVLPFEERRQQLIHMMMDIMNQEIIKDIGIYWDGLVIDFEELRNTATNPVTGIRENTLYDGKLMSELYIQFLQELKQALSSTGAGKDLYAAVPFSTYYDGYNYRAIGEIADKVIVMAHDYEPKYSIKKSDVMLYVNNPAFVDSLASITRIDKAIHALTNPETGIQDTQKIILQISFGTAQWKFPNIEKPEDWQTVPLQTAGIYSTPSYGQIYQRMTSQLDPGVPNYIKPLESPYLAYYNSTDKTYNFILYEDSRSVEEKIKKAQEAGIGGISIWSLGRIPSYQNPTNENGTNELYFDVWTQILQSVNLKFMRE